MVPYSSGPSQACYSKAFGLVIRSDFPIRELRQLSVEGDVEVDLEIVHQEGLLPSAPGLAATTFSLRQPGAEPIDELHWNDVGSFRIIGDNRIEYDAPPGVSKDLLCLPLLGIVMAVLLHHRGLLVLHGSAVKIDGQASVFLGDKGAGKSTTAASLVAAGHFILTDDVVALEWDSDGPLRLWPGFGQVKLNEDASNFIELKDSRLLERPHEDFPKSRFELSIDFDTSPVEVSEILVLERGHSLEITPLLGHKGVFSLMRYAYLERFGGDFFKGSQAKNLLEACSRVSQCSDIGRIEVPSNLSDLGGLGAFLIKHRATRC